MSARPVPSRADRVRGAVFGLAFGDALAARAEFLSVAEICERWPPAGPTELESPALITDDTQLAVVVTEALTSALSARSVTVGRVEARLCAKLSEWFFSSDNTRSPGLTCLAAAARLSQGFEWRQSTIIHSKGCGANMRVPPVGLLSLSAIETDDGAPLSIGALAQFQAAMTHGHPTALAASDLTAEAVRFLATGGEPDDLMSNLHTYADAQRVSYHEAWLGTLWEQQPACDNGVQCIARGWAECERALDRVDAALATDDDGGDVCDRVGGGWIAEELLSAALLAFLRHRTDPQAALRRAAVTRGDSDSIAAVAGALAGAHFGASAWPAAWYDRVEWRQRLDATCAAILSLDR
ncbi:MAG: ADP-ribosylglycohydrolase family protein [Myxococcales bacterium]|nr:ADP-ribosylglycohydrolase family protein [Myxococcales bacterium]MCB9521682.1 ADP-ribosylglycohydrolase family protein [Myxococcales bacterium]MCB9532269.1 ADP-ribosylglycohydrolase family protein [Myxococcales bacterium]MCB9533956.1 ADP-ribosylglycohydrolase family protein [Myxococcales bacterium]